MKLINGDCLEVMKTLPTNSVDSIVSDLPLKQLYDILIYR